MAQADPHRARRGPTRRTDATRPATTRTRRGGTRPPYPTAAATTRVSPGKPGAPRTRAGSNDERSTPTPATVWTCGADLIDLDAPWPPPLVRRVVTAFSTPGARVVLLPWPTANPPRATASTGPGEPAGGEPDRDLRAALAEIERLDRAGSVLRLPSLPTRSAAAGSRPFWADLLADPDPGSAGAGPLLEPVHASVVTARPGAGQADLIITGLRTAHPTGHTADLVAVHAAQLLRGGGILAVLTHCDWDGDELVDPTGAVVAAAQNADLLFLQHIAALHVPVRDGAFALPPQQPSAARWPRRAGGGAGPVPHMRIHSDVLVFAQPRNYRPPLPSPAESADLSGVRR